MKYKVGDKVLIRKDLKAIHDPWGTEVIKLELAGTEQTIHHVGDSCTYDGIYYSMESDPYWCFTDEMIERKVDMFTKDDLKTGDLLDTKDGLYMVMRGTGNYDHREDFLINDRGNYLRFDYFDSELRSLKNCCGDYTIMKIYRGYCGESYCSLKSGNVSKESLSLIWERNETKKMTVKEVCEALGYDVEIVKE